VGEISLPSSAVGQPSRLGWISQQLLRLLPSLLSPLALPTGRDPEINQEALKDFKEFSGFTGLDSENMIIPQQRGKEIGLLSSLRPHRRESHQVISQAQATSHPGFVPSGVMGDGWRMEGPGT
jgi:hypothetical protein